MPEHTQTPEQIPPETLREAALLIIPELLVGEYLIRYHAGEMSEASKSMLDGIATALAKRDAKIEELEAALKVYGDRGHWIRIPGFAGGLKRTFMYGWGEGHELAQSVLTPKTGDSTNGK